jgi:lipopolysaccharide export system protein LptA
VQISSTTLEVHDKDKRAVFLGNVIVGQGDTTMKSKTLDVLYDQDNDPSAPSIAMGQNGNNQVRRLEAKGGVVVTQKDLTATGETGIFEVKQNNVTLIGGVVMTQGQQVMRGERLVVDLTSGVSHFEGGGRGTQMLLYPNQVQKRGGARSADGNGKPEEAEDRTGEAQSAETRPLETRAEPGRKGARPAARSPSGEPLRLN